ncbi:MAG: FAD:protein FMN transferase [Planctomycetota bacterium]
MTSVRRESSTIHRDSAVSLVSKRLTAVVMSYVLLLLALVACGDSSSASKPPRSFGGATMGSTWIVKIPESALEGKNVDGLFAGAKAVLKAVNAEMSTYLPNSELSRFNASSSTDWQACSTDLAGVVKRSLAIGVESGGAMDVTLGPVVNLWGFGPGNPKREVPHDAALTLARERTGLDRLKFRVEPPALRKTHSSLYVDLSASAKGHGVDRVAMFLESEGIHSYFVEVGGELRARGKKDNGSPWRVAIERPQDIGRGLQRLIEIGDRAIATSGDYRNFFKEEGRRFSHTIDPRTGRPVVHSLASVSVVHERCESADAWATALMVLGPVKGYELALERNLVAFFIVRRESGFEELRSPAFDQLFGKERKE